MTSQPHWYPVYTNPRAEKATFSLLQKKGITAYLPLQRILKQWSDRKKWVEEPLIKSYLFVKIYPEQQAEVLMTKGVARFIYFSGKIASIPEKQIEMVKQWLSSGLAVEVSNDKFSKGQDIEIIAGPLKGLKGELVDFQNEKRLILKIDSIGQTLLIQIPNNAVRII